MTPETFLAPAPAAASTTERPRWSWRTHWVAAAIIAISFVATTTATMRTSTTFDEIIMLAGGARGWDSGRFDIQPEHPPLPLYLYGLAVHLAGPTYPDPGVAPAWRTPDGEVTGVLDFEFRYQYSRGFFEEPGNDPVRLAAAGRAVSALFAALSVLLVYAYTRRRFGGAAGLFAAALAAFLPDLLAHGGVAYNDAPLTFAWLAALWAADRATRAPSVVTGTLFGLAAALAMAVKFSAVVVLPAAALIVLAEGVARRGERGWLRSLAVASASALVAFYLALVAVYGGDMALAELRYGLDFTFMHVNQGHGAPAYLLGDRSMDGWWYFYPVAFVFKTPAAFHLLLILALLGLVGEARPAWRAALSSPLRMPVIGILVFGAALVNANLAIGFRYALPLLPLLCIVAGAGLALLHARSARVLRVVLVALVVWHGASVLSWWPYFLPYTSEYGPGRDLGHTVLLDSSYDWGQGLLALRDWMRDEGVERVYLGYFGSASPRAYGVDYVPMASFFPLDPVDTAGRAPPRWAAVSATNFHGLYLPGDPFALLRRAVPDVVLGHTMLLYRLEEGP